jgi:hypothetical protein
LHAHRQEDQHKQADGGGDPLANAANAQLLPLLADDGALLKMLTGDVAPKFSTCLERFEKEWLTTKGHDEKKIEYLEVGAELAF